MSSAESDLYLLLMLSCVMRRDFDIGDKTCLIEGVIGLRLRRVECDPVISVEFLNEEEGVRG